MMYIAAILKTQYDNDLLAMLVEYDTIYTRHRQIVKDAKEIHANNPPIPIELMAKGIESKLDIAKKTQQMMETLTKLSVIKESRHWGVKHILKKYNTGLLAENAQVRLCCALSAKLKSLPVIKEKEEE